MRHTLFAYMILLLTVFSCEKRCNIRSEKLGAIKLSNASLKFDSYKEVETLAFVNKDGDKKIFNKTKDWRFQTIIPVEVLCATNLDYSSRYFEADYIEVEFSSDSELFNYGIYIGINNQYLPDTV